MLSPLEMGCTPFCFDQSMEPYEEAGVPCRSPAVPCMFRERFRSANMIRTLTLTAVTLLIFLAMLPGSGSIDASPAGPMFTTSKPLVTPTFDHSCHLPSPMVCPPAQADNVDPDLNTRKKAHRYPSYPAKHLNLPRCHICRHRRRIPRQLHLSGSNHWSNDQVTLSLHDASAKFRRQPV